MTDNFSRPLSNALHITIFEFRVWIQFCSSNGAGSNYTFLDFFFSCFNRRLQTILFLFLVTTVFFLYIYKYWLINASNFDDLILFRDDFEIYCNFIPKETNVVRSIAKQRNKNNVQNMPTFSPGFLILKEKTVGVLVQSFC